MFPCGRHSLQLTGPNVTAAFEVSYSWSTKMTHPVSVGTYLLHLEPLGTVTLRYLATHLNQGESATGAASQCVNHHMDVLCSARAGSIPLRWFDLHPAFSCRDLCSGEGHSQTRNSRWSRRCSRRRCLPLRSSLESWWEILQRRDFFVQEKQIWETRVS